MIDSVSPSIMPNRVSPTAWVRPGTTLAFEVARNRKPTTTRKAMVMARCELVKARCTVPTTGRVTSPKSRPGRGVTWNWCSGSAIGRSGSFVFVVEGNRLRLPVLLRLGHQALRRAPRHPHRDGEAQQDPADNPHRRGAGEMVDRPADRQADENPAEQIGDDLPGLAGRRMARRLRGGVAGRARLQVGCALRETSDRLFARFRFKGHGGLSAPTRMPEGV